VALKYARALSGLSLLFSSFLLFSSLPLSSLP
jgi:hypothetical protein